MSHVRHRITFTVVSALCLGFSMLLAHSVSAQTIVVSVGGAGSVGIPDKNANDPRSRADRAIIDAFEAIHQNIRLVNATGLQISGPASESNLLMAFAGGAAPDVVYVNFRSMENYIDQGFLQPLDSYLETDPALLSRVNPVIRRVITVRGHVYAMPWAQFVQALYYRRDLFEQAGLDPDKPPATWPEFYEDCRRITNQKTGIWGFEWPNDAGGAAYWWVNLLWQAGGEITRQTSSGQWVAAFDTSQGATALIFYKHLVDDPYISPIDGKKYYGVTTNKNANWSTDRGLGKVAMWFQYQSNVVANLSDANSVNPSLVGIAALPTGPGGHEANEINASMWGLSSQIKDPAVRDAAWKFIAFTCSDEADRIRTKAYVEAGLGNLINPLTLARYGYQDQITHVTQGWLDANRSLFLHGHPEPYGANMQSIYDILGQPLQAISLNPSADPKLLLADAARQVNDKLIGYTPPAQMATRREAAWTIFFLLALGAALLGVRRAKSWRRSVASLPHGPRPADAGSSPVVAKGYKRRLELIAWTFMVPAILSIVLWAYFPLLRGLVIAFQDYRIILGSRFVGLDNFIDVFTSFTFWKGLLNALLYTLYSLGLGFFLPIFLALMLSEIPRGTVFFRVVYYLPAVTTGLILSVLWKLFEAPSPTGMLNQALGLLHVPPQDFLGDPRTAMLSVVLPSIWAGTGPGCIIYLAAMRSIPDEMYEAADLDGASIATKFWRLTVPTLWPLIIINLVGATIGAFQANQNIFVMTGGGPLYATHTIGLEIWYNAFLYLKFGYATAASWVMGSLLIGFTMFQLRMMRNLRFAGASG